MVSCLLHSLFSSRFHYLAMAPVPPGDYSSNPWPCRIKADFTPLTEVKDRLKVKKGEEGVITQYANQQCRIEIDRSNPRRIGWLHEKFVQVSTENLHFDLLFPLNTRCFDGLSICPWTFTGREVHRQNMNKCFKEPFRSRIAFRWLRGLRVLY